MTNANEPAYPANAVRTENGAEWREYVPGLTKREAFAMAAMQGLSANPEGAVLDAAGCASMAVARADALFAELEKTP